MHKHITRDRASNRRNRGVNQNKTVKIIVTLLAILIILTISFSAAQTPAPLKVSDGTEMRVLPANLIWDKTYGGAI